MKFFESFRWRSLAVIIATSGYLVDSGSYYRLWFGFGLGSGVKNPIQWKGLDCYRLLHEAEEELAARLFDRSPRDCDSNHKIGIDTLHRTSPAEERAGNVIRITPWRAFSHGDRN